MKTFKLTDSKGKIYIVKALNEKDAVNRYKDSKKIFDEIIVKKDLTAKKLENMVINLYNKIKSSEPQKEKPVNNSIAGEFHIEQSRVLNLYRESSSNGYRYYVEVGNLYDRNTFRKELDKLMKLFNFNGSKGDQIIIDDGRKSAFISEGGFVLWRYGIAIWR